VIPDEEREMGWDRELVTENMIKIQGEARMKETSIPPPERVQKSILVNTLGRKGGMTSECIPIPRFVKMAAQHESIKMRITG